MNRRSWVIIPAHDPEALTRYQDSKADVAVLDLRTGTYEFVDNFENKRAGTQRLFPSATVLAGKPTPSNLVGRDQDMEYNKSNPHLCTRCKDGPPAQISNQSDCGVGRLASPGYRADNHESRQKQE